MPLSSCLLLPHGLYSLLITVLVTIGWVASLLEDGCTYARVTGPTADELAFSPDAPYVEVGLQAYRVPHYNAALAEWNDAVIGQCLAYPRKARAGGRAVEICQGVFLFGPGARGRRHAVSVDQRVLSLQPGVVAVGGLRGGGGVRLSGAQFCVVSNGIVSGEHVCAVLREPGGYRRDRLVAGSGVFDFLPLSGAERNKGRRRDCCG